MSDRPFMQLYVSDYLGDTQHLSTEQHGAYLLLLMAMWNADGYLPNDEAKLARVCRCTVKRWRQIRPEVFAFFIEKDGMISQARMTRELQKVVSKTELRRLAGSMGGRAKSLKYSQQALAKATSLLPVLPLHNQIPEPDRDFFGDVPTESPLLGEGILLDRFADEADFKACEGLMGYTVPLWRQQYRFPTTTVEKARGKKDA